MVNRTRRAALTVLAALALMMALVAPSMADDKSDLNKKKRELTGQIGKAKADADHSSKQLSRAQSALKKARTALSSAKAELSRTQGQLAVAKAKDAQMQAELSQAEVDLAKARKQLAKGEKDLKKAEAVVEQFTVESVQSGDSGLRAFNGLLSGESPEEFTEQMSINSSVGEAQVATMQELEAARVVLKLKRDDVEKLRDKVKVARAAAAANLQTQKTLTAQAQEQTQQVSALVAQRGKASKAAQKALQADLAQLKQLEDDRARVQAQIAALAAKDVKTGGKGVGGDSGGALSYPVNGPITSPYGMRVHPVTGVYKLHDGTDFGVGCGTPIRAAASGTVIQQYYNGGYGNRVILNNGVKRGVSVVTTYNHLSRYAVSTGAKVKRGQVIGYVGSTGYSTGCHLHFMVLVNGQTTQPMNWL